MCAEAIQLIFYIETSAISPQTSFTCIVNEAVGWRCAGRFTSRTKITFIVFDGES